MSWLLQDRGPALVTRRFAVERKRHGCSPLSDKRRMQQENARRDGRVGARVSYAHCPPSPAPLCRLWSTRVQERQWKKCDPVDIWYGADQYFSSISDVSMLQYGTEMAQRMALLQS